MLREWRVSLGSEARLLLLLLTLVQSPRSALAILAPPEVAVDSRVDCALHLSRSHLADTTHITVLGYASWVEHFPGVTNVPVTLLQLLDDRVQVLNSYLDVAFVVFSDRGNNSSVKDVLSVLRNRSFYHARVVVWWHAGRTRDVRATMDAARNLEIVRLAVVTGSRGSHSPRVFGYREHCEDGSPVVRAVHVGTCDDTGKLQVDGDLFADPLRWNLEGCALRLCCAHLPPFYTLSEHQDGDVSLSGWSKPLALSLGRRLNGTLDVRQTHWTHGFGGEAPNGTTWGVLGDLLHGHCDVVFGSIYLTETRYNLADFSPSHNPSCVALTIPAGLGRVGNPLAVVYRVFPSAVWALLGTTGLVVIALLTLSWWGVNKHPLGDAILFTLSVLLGHPYALPASASHVKMLIGFWLMNCIVLNTAYQAVRHSLLAAPDSPPDINSLSELAQAGLAVVGHYEALAMLKQNAHEEGNATMLTLAEHSNGVDGLFLMESLGKLIAKRDMAIFYSSIEAEYWATTLENRDGQKLVHQIPDFCGVVIHVAHLMLRRGSRLTRAVVSHMHQASDMGLIYDFEQRYRTRRLAARKDPSPFSVAKLRATFLLLLIGLGVSALAFVIEISINTT